MKIHELFQLGTILRRRFLCHTILTRLINGISFILTQIDSNRQRWAENLIANISTLSIKLFLEKGKIGMHALTYPCTTEQRILIKPDEQKHTVPDVLISLLLFD